MRNPGTPEAASTFGTKLELGDGRSAFLGTQEIPATGQTWAKLEFNPSRIVDPEGHRLAEVVELPSAVREVWSAGLELVEPACELEDARVPRIDVARDFEGIARPAALLTGLATVHRPWSRKNALFNDGSANGAQTLLVGSKAGSVRLYDKHAETVGAVPEGVLRWEAQARRDWAQKYGSIDRVGDLNTESVGQLAANRWEWSGMGLEVSGTEEAVEKVMRCEWLSAAEQRGLLGWLMIVSAGRESPLSKHTAAKYRSAARALGITLSTDLFGDGGGFVVRLDWETGREVLRAA